MDVFGITRDDYIDYIILDVIEYDAADMGVYLAGKVES